MANEEKKRSFWETLPGIITAIAALITAIAAFNSGANENAPKAKADAAKTVPEVDDAVRRAISAWLSGRFLLTNGRVRR